MSKMKKYVSPELEALNFVVEEGIMTNLESLTGGNNDDQLPNW